MPQSDCLFCGLYAQGDHVRKDEGFAAVRDINPKAPTHLLVIPERHVDTFRDVGEFPAHEAKRMLEFVADTARDAGLEDGCRGMAHLPTGTRGIGAAGRRRAPR